MSDDIEPTGNSYGWHDEAPVAPDVKGLVERLKLQHEVGLLGLPEGHRMVSYGDAATALEAAMARAEAAHARAERLEAALMPFAHAATAFPVNANPLREKNNLETIIWSYQRNHDGSEERIELTVPHLRAAHAALSTKGEDER